MAVQKSDKAEAASSTAAADERTICVVDLGRQSRKRIKRLKRGKGKLMRKVENVLDEVTAEGVVPDGAAAVVVVVKQEASLASIFDDDDD